MILIIIAVCIIIAIAGFLVTEISINDIVETIGIAMSVVGSIAFGVSIVATVTLAISVSNLNVIDDKIAMYQEENARIESQIETAVSEYMEYESSTFKELTPDTAITMASIYPELKANELVQTQISIYACNNEVIKELKVSKISGSVYRWWLYFGKEK